jgi:hypothetical protein
MSCNKKVAWSAVIISAIAVLLNLLRFKLNRAKIEILSGKVGTFGRFAQDDNLHPLCSFIERGAQL